MKIIKQFTSDNWQGSYYELSIQLSSKPNIDKIIKTLNIIFNECGIKGPFIDNSCFENKAELTEVHIIDVTILYGLVIIENIELGVVIDIVREEKNDWISISFPTGMIEKSFAVKYPFYQKTNPWIKIIDSFFINLCKSISKYIEIEIAFIGEEISCYIPENEVTKEIIERGGIIVNKSTYERNKMIGKIIKIDNELYYIPPKEMLNITYGKNPTIAST